MDNRAGGRAPARRSSLSRKIAGRLERLSDRVIELCDRALLGGYRVARWPLARRLVRLVADVALTLRYLRGVEARLIIGPAGRVVVAAPPNNAEFLRHCLMPDAQQQVPLGRLPLWQLRARTRRWLAGGVDLVVVEVSRLVPSDGGLPVALRVPTWVNQELAIPDPVDRLIAGTPRRGLRGSVNKASRAGFGWLHTRDPALFERFYRDMYIPTARVRHEALAVVAPYAKQKWWFDRNGLLLVTRDGEPVGGGLTHVDGTTCVGVEGGMRDGDHAVYQAGGNAYLLWANVLWARERGATRFNMGGSRPLRSDPSFAYKRKWGAQVVRRQRPYAQWLLQAQTIGPLLRRRINGLGFVAERRGAFCGVWLAGDEPVDLEALRGQLREDGLDGPVVVHPGVRPTPFSPACPGATETKSLHDHAAAEH